MRKYRVMLACLSLLWFTALSPEAVRSVKAGAQDPAPAAQAQPAAAAAPATPAGALVNRYCVTCHNRKVAVNGTNANLHLDEADQVNVANSAEIWEKVIVKLRMRSMPPQGNRRPENAQYDTVVKYLETELDKAASLKPNPGQLGMHRLNRVEYGNSVRD